MGRRAILSDRGFDTDHCPYCGQSGLSSDHCRAAHYRCNPFCETKQQQSLRSEREAERNEAVARRPSGFASVLDEDDSSMMYLHDYEDDDENDEEDEDDENEDEEEEDDHDDHLVDDEETVGSNPDDFDSENNVLEEDVPDISQMTDADIMSGVLDVTVGEEDGGGMTTRNDGPPFILRHDPPQNHGIDTSPNVNSI